MSTRSCLLSLTRPNFLARVRNRKMRTSLALAAVVATVAGSAFMARAATLTWDSSGVNPGAPQGGNGTWDLTNFRWSNGSGDIKWTDTSANGVDVAVFNSNISGGAVTLNTALSAGGLLFQTGGYAISGTGALKLGSAGIDASAVGSGTISIANAITLGTVPQSWNVGFGGTLLVSGAVNNNGANLSISGSGNTSLTGIVSGTGTVNNTGSGTLTLSGVNTFNSAMSINGGATIVVRGAGRLNSGNYSGAITNNGSLTFASNSAGQTLTGVISGSGILTQSLGTLRLTANSTFTGNVTINGGTLSISGGGNGTSSPLGNVNNGKTVEVDAGGTLNFIGGNELGGGGVNPNFTLNIIGGTVTDGNSNSNRNLGTIILNGGTINTNGGANNTQYEAFGIGGTVTVNGTAPSFII